jgi:uncharacterized protein YegP (UPF0339 family)
MAAHFFVGRDVLGRYQWHLKDDDGIIIARSGAGYQNRKEAHDAIDSVKGIAPGAAIVDNNVDYAPAESDIVDQHTTAVERQNELKQLYKKLFPRGVMISD